MKFLMHQTKKITAKGLARVQSLVEIATDLFFEYGYENISLDELIEKSGGSKRIIYQHFGDKHGLFIEVIKNVCQRISNKVTKLDLATDQEQVTLQIFGEQCLNIVLDEQVLALHRLMIYESKLSPELAKTIYKAGHKSVTDTLAIWIEQKQAQTIFRKDIPALDLARFFIDALVTTPQYQAILGINKNYENKDFIQIHTKKCVSYFFNAVQFNINRSKEL